MKLSKIILPALFMAALISPALAEDTANDAIKTEGARAQVMRYHPADANQDGVLSRAEFDAHNEARFKEMDKDGDGNITTEEMRAHMQARRDVMKERMGERKKGEHMRGEYKRGEGVKAKDTPKTTPVEPKAE